MRYCILPVHHALCSRLCTHGFSSTFLCRSLLKDLREVRQGKAREGLEHLNPVELNVSVISLSLLCTAILSLLCQVTGFSQMELNEIRPFFSLAFKRLLQLDPQESERQETMEEEPGELDDGMEEHEFGYDDHKREGTVYHTNGTGHRRALSVMSERTTASRHGPW